MEGNKSSVEGNTDKNKISSDSNTEKNKMNITLIAFCVIISGIFLNLFLFGFAINLSARKLYDTFTDERDKVIEDTYSNVIDYFRKDAARKTHTSNRVDLKIDSIHEVAMLEVMEANDVEYVIEKPSDNSHNYTRWAKTTGRAVYTVNLEESEIVADSVRNIVYFRIPGIEYRIVELKTEPLLVNDGLNLELDWNKLTKIGAEMALKQERIGEEKVREEFGTNPQYVAEAKKSAESVLKQLVQSLNPDVKDKITVIIDYDE